MSSPTVERLHLGPGELWSGRRAYTCDGAILRVTRNGEDIVDAEIQQLHDINRARHRTRAEMLEHLRRCLKTLQRDGIVYIKNGQADVIPADCLRTSAKVSLHVFHQAENEYGPFRASKGGDRG